MTTWTRHLNDWPAWIKENCVQHLFRTYGSLGNTWALLIFSLPLLIISPSLWLKHVYPGFITCYSTTIFTAAMLALVTEVLGLRGRLSSSTEYFPALKALTHLKTVRIEMVWGPYIQHNSLNICFESILSLMQHLIWLRMSVFWSLFQCNKETCQYIWLHLFQFEITRSVGKQFARNERVSLAIQNTIQVQWSILKYTRDKTKEAY